jgi:2-dehydropantoate 2-reductase
MKICIYGAGAIGGHVAVRLARAGHEVSVVARGAHLAAIQATGLTLDLAGEKHTAKVAASDDADDLGPQELVIATVKAIDPAGLAEGIGPLLGAGTPVVFAQNGIPWWYAHGRDAASLPDLTRLDPRGSLAREVGAARAVGCVIHSPNTVVAPGVIHTPNATMHRLVLGEPNGTVSARIKAIAAAIAPSGLGAEVVADIRPALWNKLLRNTTNGPICTVLGQPIVAIGRDAVLCALARAVAREVMAVAAAYGIVLDVDVEKEFAPAAYKLPHKPSILQDLEAGKPMEIDAIYAVVQDFARHRDVPTPHFDAVVALVAAKARAAGCYR